MADEIFYSLRFQVRKNGATVDHTSSGNQTMTGDDIIQGTQVIGTASELVSFGEIAGAPAQVLIQNLDTVNFIEIGGDAGLTVFKLKILAGKSSLISPSSGTVYAKADTAAVRILIVAAEA